MKHKFEVLGIVNKNSEKAREKELEKLINKDLEKYLDFKLEPQTEMSFEEKYRPFLNVIEEIQTKVLEIKTGR